MVSVALRCPGKFAEAKDLTFKAKAKDSKFVLDDTSRPRTKAKDNNTGYLTTQLHGHCS